MVPKKSLDYSKVITTLLCDVQTLHSNVFTSRALKLTLRKVRARLDHEGLGFLTKTLPRLGKALDRALSGSEQLDSARLAFTSLPNSKLPRFLGELFQCVLNADGAALADANAAIIRSLRDICFCFYKLELPFDPKLEQQVIDGFVRTEDEILHYHELFAEISKGINDAGVEFYSQVKPESSARTIREARKILSRVFSNFDPLDIYPRHGPGAVSTGEKLYGKYTWTTIPKRLTEVYPLDAYFYASIGHVCDSLSTFSSINESELSAKVILVPKDSRGPRLISCEPLAFQWIQQGLSRHIVQHVESHPITKWSVRFTDQNPNRIAALMGSKHGRYSTLDLKEASDRVTVGLVTCLFPEPLLECLLASRSLSTRLPNGRELKLNKFAPMGSALCFPVLALTVWSLLYAGLKTLDENVLGEDILVYGDDVVVPTQWAEHAMNILESFGLKINRDKSCTKGFFRESCGLDAYKGVQVTPVRFRTPWSSSRCPDSYTSWISYANSLYDRKYFSCYEYIVDELRALYGHIPEEGDGLTVPSLREAPQQTPRAKRFNRHLQKMQYKVWDSLPRRVHKELDGWAMLLRYFSEACSKVFTLNAAPWRAEKLVFKDTLMSIPFSVRLYTQRRRNQLRLCWR